MQNLERRLVCFVSVGWQGMCSCSSSIHNSSSVVLYLIVGIFPHYFFMSASCCAGPGCSYLRLAWWTRRQRVLLVTDNVKTHTHSVHCSRDWLIVTTDSQCHVVTDLLTLCGACSMCLDDNWVNRPLCASSTVNVTSR